MLVKDETAQRFLAAYKELIKALNQGVEPTSMEQYAKLRDQIYDYRDNHPQVYDNAVSPDWLAIIKQTVFGDFIYLKKYQKGYVFQDVNTGTFYQVLGLTTPLEETLSEYMIVKTALVPFEGQWLCDGLLYHKALIGKNMAKELRDAYAEAKKQKQVIA
jgi:hypothetical protein